MATAVAKFSCGRADWAVALGPAGACAYIAGAALPFAWDIPLIALALSGGYAAVFRREDSPAARSPLLVPVLFFLMAAGISILASEDRGQSLKFSAPLVPAVLLFFLISDHFPSPRHIRALYLTFSVVGLGLALQVLRQAWMRDWVIPPGWQNWIADAGSPTLVVSNDTAFLGVIAPLSLALFWCEARKAVRALAALSIVLSVGAVCVIQSRVAILTLIASLLCAAVLLRPRLALLGGLGMMAATLLIDGSLGFPLVTKFGQIWDAGAGRLWDGRIPIWSAAWASFREAPLVGHGPHTFQYTSVDAISLRWAHNLYLETLAEQGIVGLAGLAFLLYSGFRAARSLPCAEPAEGRILAVGALAALLGFCLAAFLELSFVRQWVGITLFTLLGIIGRLTSGMQRKKVNP